MLSAKDKFQYEVATGRFSLPVAVIVSVLLWALTTAGERDWTNIFSLLAYGFTAYALLEIDTRFALIRTRTALPGVWFLVFYAAVPFLHQWTTYALLPVLFILMYNALFGSYESHRASGAISQAFFFLSLASFILPAVLWVAPLLYLCMISLRSLSLRTFFAGVLGLMLPYWLLFGYYAFCDRLPEMLPYVERLVDFAPVDYSVLSVPHYVSWGITLLFFIAYSVFYPRSAHKDKVQTRILLRIFIWTGIWVNLLMLVQPGCVAPLLPVVFLSCAMLGAHLFSLMFGKEIRVLFIATLLAGVLLTVFNLWMHFFSF